MAREPDRNWYARLPDTECDAAREFAHSRRAYWDLVREVWDEMMDNLREFLEGAPKGLPPRFVTFWQMEEDARSLDLLDADTRADIPQRRHKVIDLYRVQP